MNLYYLDDSDYNLIINELQKIIADKKLIPRKLSEINVGDKVYINFYPNSQKYIYTLYPKLGTVKNIKIYELDDCELDDCELDDYEFPSITIENYKGEVEELFHNGVSYYGDSLGYDYSIFLVE